MIEARSRITRVICDGARDGTEFLPLTPGR